MRLFFLSTWLILGVVLLLTGCLSFKKNDPLAPERLRLKSIGDGSSITSIYSYDSLNRLSGIISGIEVVVIQYGDPRHQYPFPDTEHQAQDQILYFRYPNGTDRLKGWLTAYPLHSDSTKINAFTYSLSGTYVSTFMGTYVYYTFNLDKTLKESDTGKPSDPVLPRETYYTYTGKNITQASTYTAADARTPLQAITYQYDDKINPFYHQLIPVTNEVFRFSPNNPTQQLTTVPQAMPVTYEYEYNAQNLPTKRTAKQNGVVIGILTYTYESY